MNMMRQKNEDQDQELELEHVRRIILVQGIPDQKTYIASFADSKTSVGFVVGVSVSDRKPLLSLSTSLSLSPLHATRSGSSRTSPR